MKKLISKSLLVFLGFSMFGHVAMSTCEGMLGRGKQKPVFNKFQIGNEIIDPSTLDSSITNFSGDVYYGLTFNSIEAAEAAIKEIFTQGRDNSQYASYRDLARHLSGFDFDVHYRNVSSFLSTTSDYETALKFAAGYPRTRPKPFGIVFTIDARGKPIINIEALGDSRDESLSDEDEITFDTRIDPSWIKSAVLLKDPYTNTRIAVYKNPKYKGTKRRARAR